MEIEYLIEIIVLSPRPNIVSTYVITLASVRNLLVAMDVSLCSSFTATFLLP